MGCGTAGANIVPIGLGKVKLVKSWKVYNPNSPSEDGPTVTVNFSEAEEEGIYCVMKGMNFRKQSKRECKDGLFMIKKEGSLDFAVCVLDGMGKYWFSLKRDILKKRVEDEFFFKMVIPEESAVKEKLAEIINNMDRQIAFENKCDFRLSGCTFTLLLCYGNVFYVANIGAAHCLHTLAKEPKYGASSRGNISSVGGSEIFKMSNMSGGSGFTAKTATFATTNPMKAVAFLYRATGELMTNLYGGKFSGSTLSDVRNTQMETLTTDHSVTNYEELLRLTQAGSTVCKDRKKVDLPYYAIPFKFYLNPLVPHTDLTQSSDWPALRCSRAVGCIEARKIGLLCKPDICVKKIHKPQDKYLVIATDGLWSVVEAIETVSLVEKSLAMDNASVVRSERLNQNSQAILNTKDDQKKPTFPKDTNLAKVLAAHAKYRWANMAARHNLKVDDITVVVIGIS